MAMQDPFEPFKKMMSQYYGNPTKQDLKDTLKKLPKEKKVKDLIKAADIASYATIPFGGGVVAGVTKAPKIANAISKGTKLVKGAKSVTANKVPTQKYTSKDTDLDQIASTFKSEKFDNEVNSLLQSKPFVRNLDYGGGKGTKSTPFLETKGVKNSIYDPYNQTATHNVQILKEFRKNPADVATINNVLNVIKEKPIRKEAVKNAYDLLRPNGKLFVKIYEGDRKGVGQVTAKGWQNNKSTSAYLKEIAEVVGKENVKRKDDIIIITKPQVLKAVPDLPKPAKRELDPALLKELKDFINKNLLPENVADFKSFAVKKKK